MSKGRREDTKFIINYFDNILNERSRFRRMSTYRTFPFRKLMEIARFLLSKVEKLSRENEIHVHTIDELKEDRIIKDDLLRLNLSIMKNQTKEIDRLKEDNEEWRKRFEPIREYIHRKLGGFELWTSSKEYPKFTPEDWGEIDRKMKQASELD